MDEGSNNFVAHFSRPPLDITNETAGLNQKRQAAMSRCSTPEARLMDNEQQIKVKTLPFGGASD